MVLVSKENKRAIFQYILKEGVIVVKKDAYVPIHPQLTNISNIEVMMITKSLRSKNYLEDVFCWNWGYYFVTEEGIKFLAKSLGVPEDIVPATMKKKRPVAAIPKTDKAEDDAEKPGRPEGEEEAERATGAGRGTRA